MIELEVALDARNLKKLKLLKQASGLAAAKALTFTAEKAVPAWKEGQACVLHRRNGWIDKGVRMRPATAGNLESQVGTLDKFLGRHIKGIHEEKQAAPGHRLLVPMYNDIGDVGTHRQLRRKLQAAEGTKRKPFEIRTHGETLLVRRKTKRKTPLIVIGKLMHQVDIPERLDALGIVDGVVNREFPKVYERVLLAHFNKG